MHSILADFNEKKKKFISVTHISTYITWNKKVQKISSDPTGSNILKGEPLKSFEIFYKLNFFSIFFIAIINLTEFVTDF